MRTIKIHLNTVDLNKELIAAIGYLSLRCFNGYDEVTIGYDFGHQDEKTPSLLVHYKNTENLKTFTIGAIWDGKSYSFHS